MKTLPGAAWLAACISATAIGGLASSAQAGDIHIFVADLNLQTQAGMAEYQARVDIAARQMCLGYDRLRDVKHSVCMQAVQSEAKETMEKLARQGDARVASVRIPEPGQDVGR